MTRREASLAEAVRQYERDRAKGAEGLERQHEVLYAWIRDAWGEAEAEFFDRHRTRPYVQPLGMPWPVSGAAAWWFPLPLLVWPFVGLIILVSVLGAGWAGWITGIAWFLVALPAQRIVLGWMPPRDVARRHALVEEFRSIQKQISGETSRAAEASRDERRLRRLEASEREF